MENSQAKQWVPGQNHPLIFRGHKGEICHEARIIVGNLLWHLKDEAMCADRRVVCSAAEFSCSSGLQCLAADQARVIVIIIIIINIITVIINIIVIVLIVIVLF